MTCMTPLPLSTGFRGSLQVCTSQRVKRRSDVGSPEPRIPLLSPRCITPSLQTVAVNTTLLLWSVGGILVMPDASLPTQLPSLILVFRATNLLSRRPAGTTPIPSRSEGKSGAEMTASTLLETDLPRSGLSSSGKPTEHIPSRGRLTTQRRLLLRQTYISSLQQILLRPLDPPTFSLQLFRFDPARG
ncbi:hypothetical protein F5141DRAFT_1086332 [Pisolithus sp. B1]|nr:hypothetical protein F5141DRAFT_1086332 [Pisolithus sp. B1]